MEWLLFNVLNGYFEQAWEARWIIPVLQLIMVSAIIIVGTALNMVMKRTWMEKASFGLPVNTKEGGLYTGHSHSSR